MARTSIGSTTNDWSVISGEDSNCLDDVDLNEEFGFPKHCFLKLKLIAIISAY